MVGVAVLGVGREHDPRREPADDRDDGVAMLRLAADAAVRETDALAPGQPEQLRRAPALALAGLRVAARRQLAGRQVDDDDAQAGAGGEQQRAAAAELGVVRVRGDRQHVHRHDRIPDSSPAPPVKYATRRLSGCPASPASRRRQVRGNGRAFEHALDHRVEHEPVQRRCCGRRSSRSRASSCRIGRVMSGLQSAGARELAQRRLPAAEVEPVRLAAAARRDGEVVSTAPLVRRGVRRARSARQERCSGRWSSPSARTLRIDVAREQLVAGRVEDPHDLVEPCEVDVERRVQQAGADQLGHEHRRRGQAELLAQQDGRERRARARDGVDVVREHRLGEPIDPAVRRLAIARATRSRPTRAPARRRPAAARAPPAPSAPPDRRAVRAASQIPRRRRPSGRTMRIASRSDRARSASCQMTAVVDARQRLLAGRRELRQRRGAVVARGLLADVDERLPGAAPPSRSARRGSAGGASRAANASGIGEQPALLQERDVPRVGEQVLERAHGSPLSPPARAGGDGPAARSGRASS